MNDIDTNFLTTMFGETLMKGLSDRVSTKEALKDTDLVALYFSASWCPPCRQFTPVLIDFYNKVASKHNVQVIFVSSDQDDTSFSNYYAKMPWLAIPPDQRSVKEYMAQKLKIRGIPALVVLDARTGFFVTSDARNDVSSAAGDVRRGAEVIASWKTKESVPLDLAMLGTEQNSFTLSAMLGYFMRNPLLIVLLIYALQKIMAWFQK